MLVFVGVREGGGGEAKPRDPEKTSEQSENQQPTYGKRFIDFCHGVKVVLDRRR